MSFSISPAFLRASVIAGTGPKMIRVKKEIHTIRDHVEYHSSLLVVPF